MRGLSPFSSTTEMGTCYSLVPRIILPLCGTRTTESAWVLTVAITERSGVAMFPVCWNPQLLIPLPIFSFPSTRCVFLS
jgi:hypothetical protein